MMSRLAHFARSRPGARSIARNVARPSLLARLFGDRMLVLAGLLLGVVTCGIASTPAWEPLVPQQADDETAEPAGPPAAAAPTPAAPIAAAPTAIVPTSLAPPAAPSNAPAAASQKREPQVVRAVWQTDYRDERVTVLETVWNTEERDETYTITRPVVETSVRYEKHLVNEPVTTYATQYSDRGQWLDQVVTVPGETSTHVKWVAGGWTTDSTTGLTYWRWPGFRPVKVTAAPTHSTYRVWKPNVVAVPIPHTVYKPRIETRPVAVQTVRYVEEKRTRKVPVRVCRVVPREVVRKVPVLSCRLVYDDGRMTPALVHALPGTVDVPSAAANPSVPATSPGGTREPRRFDQREAPTPARVAPPLLSTDPLLVSLERRPTR